jgi:hypothetical protein
VSAYYGCVRCQQSHWEGDGKFDTHMMNQDKHSVRQGYNPDPRAEFVAMARRYHIPMRNIVNESVRIVNFEINDFKVQIDGYHKNFSFVANTFLVGESEKLSTMSGNAHELCHAIQREVLGISS